jgi:hypothetical protein
MARQARTLRDPNGGPNIGRACITLKNSVELIEATEDSTPRPFHETLGVIA